MTSQLEPGAELAGKALVVDLTPHGRGTDCHPKHSY